MRPTVPFLYLLLGRGGYLVRFKGAAIEDDCILRCSGAALGSAPDVTSDDNKQASRNAILAASASD